MSDNGSLLSGLFVVAILVLLILFIVRGGMFGGGRGGSRVSRPGGLAGRFNRSRVARRSGLEVFFALFAIANLMTSDSLDDLGAEVVVLAMVVLVICLAVFPDLGLVVVAFGAIAAFADIALAEGTGVAAAVLVVTAFLAWIYYGVGGRVRG